MSEPNVVLPFDFPGAVIRWQVVAGRHGLPWQGTRDPFRVWLSEVMLQQTQVATVLGYYERFVTRFPDVHALAAADLTQVLALWSGLGYYGRARNLHSCARAVVSQHNGEFPRTAQILETLPGIGPSTAAAIAAFCFGQGVSILDGNVKRVVARFAGFEADLSKAVAEKKLLDIANRLLPVRHLERDMPRYTQGLMDIGAMVCTRTKPSCSLCPLEPACVARNSEDPTRLPIKSRRVARSVVAWHLLLLQRPDGEVWLERRPEKGIWAGLYCPPAYASLEKLMAESVVKKSLSIACLEAQTHVLTHREIVLSPVVCQIPSNFSNPENTSAFSSGAWVSAGRLDQIGVPAPITKLFLQLGQKRKATTQPK